MTVRLGSLALETPVILAPMAGVTNPPFRQLCREAAERGVDAAFATARRLAGHGEPAHTDADPRLSAGTCAPAGLWVCEMITSRALVEGNAETLNMIRPDPGDPVRSVQLYGVDPAVVARAVRTLAEEDLADHVDLNFGCPVPKVTRKGGGAALPWKLDLFEAIVDQAVRAARSAVAARGREIPVTVKIRIGIDNDHETFRDAARICEDAGVAGIILHARTAAQHYAGQANWDRIGDLVAMTKLPVFGNGDVFGVEDADHLLQHTGCAGIAIGRGCQGRPWIFTDLAAYFHGYDFHAEPSLREVANTIIRHGELSIAHFNGDEYRAMRELRKHISWYLRGFAVGGQARRQLALVSTLDEVKERLEQLDLYQPYPQAADGPRGRAGGYRRPHLPDGWLESRTLSPAQRNSLHLAELNISGG
ncbi:tRNA dihydrouridine synthase DusB [Actinobaculum sp. 352]|uniref:tRNA dihydrouridine synthase DusB n=2 Tax=unclassified Actinobaculum TaxID=2609299 RepID=UPI000D529DB6|nr:tRNA dihydrouridine synthase DusB [Actinobaculum sp. 352]AWE42576.1 tRNA dihydrouridine synthase DusB [Actinobaculum sp. 313]RTE48135.1 tRNA dihydrouridine synthase DusB [Actinobaculum sp. 352]